MSSSDDPVSAAFAVEDLVREARESDRAWLPFLDVETLNVGLYVLPVGGEDGQRPHELDEVYYVVDGRAKLTVEGEQHPVAPGSIVYVRAGAAHRFHSIEEELRVLVFFSAKERS